MNRRDTRALFDASIARISETNRFGYRGRQAYLERRDRGGASWGERVVLKQSGESVAVPAEVVELARRSGFRGWVFDSGMTAWVVLPPDVKHKLATFDLPCPCPRVVWRDYTSHTCLRPATEDGQCKVHAAHHRRREAAAEERQAESKRRAQAEQRRRSLEADLAGLWAMACDELGIERAGRLSMRSESTAQVDAEALRPILMRIIEGG